MTIPSDGTKLPTPADFDKVMKDKTVRRMLARPWRLDRTHDIPFLAGYSRNARTIYFDKSLPTTLLLGSKRYELAGALTTHERVEKALIDAYGWGYVTPSPGAHGYATRAEHNRLITDGVDPKAYEEAMKPYITACKERCKGEDVDFPTDLDLTPYQTGEGEAYLNALEAVQNKRRKAAAA